MARTRDSRLRSPAGVLLLLLGGLMPVRAALADTFFNFESGQVRPLALSSDRSRLYAVNTPDNRLEILSVSGAGLAKIGSVPVGMEPVAVALRSATEAWVVNHLSDSISIVDLSASPPRVVRTLLTCDEPRDIVFAGPGRNRAFVTTARRGQHCPVPFDATTPGIGRAIVQVWDAANLGAPLGGTAIANVVLFGDTPRPLAVSPDGSKVYAGIFFSGNRTTAISEGAVCDGTPTSTCTLSDGTAVPGGLPNPRVNRQGSKGPETGMIVQKDASGTAWRDPLGRDWRNIVRFNLPDKDAFEIDANATPPVETRNWASVGTILFGIATNPVTGKIYVSNTEANNLTRFEGPGILGTTVLGNLHRARITVLDSAQVNPRNLNKHIDYATKGAPGDKEKTLAQPLEMVVSADGQTLYAAAFGSSKIGVFATSELEGDTFVPDTADHIVLGGGGPTGLVLDEPRNRLYAMTRFTNSVAVVDTAARAELSSVALYDREPAAVFGGRHFNYDSYFSSQNGESSCGSCHVFGDNDNLAWDLGNPDDDVTNSPMTIKLSIAAGSGVNGDAGTNQFHPMKGPMTTQTFRGMPNHGPLHWRGDRSSGFFGSGTSASLSFNNFIVAFSGLLGRSADPSTPQMNEFTNWALSIRQPPNPVRAIDNSLTADQQAGRNFYLGSRLSDGTTLFGQGFTCNGCHTLDPANGFFGTNGDASFENEQQIMKVAHLRNVYTKVGMFGLAPQNFLNSGDNANKGDQVRGFGILHDGSTDGVFRFFQATVFNSDSDSGFNGGDAQRRQMEQYMLAFDTDFAPMVGQQVTLSSSNGVSVGPRIDAMIARAGTLYNSKFAGGNVPECDLVVKGVVNGEARGWVRLSNGTFKSDRASEAALTDSALRALANATGSELTYTCVPPGNGTRVGIDRDEDTYLDRTELDGGYDPSNPASNPSVGNPTPTPYVATPTPTPFVATPTPTPYVATPTPTPYVATPTPTPTPTPDPNATPTPTPTPYVATPTPTPYVATPTPTPYVATPTPTPTPFAGFVIRPNKLVIRDSATSPEKRTLAFTSTYAGGVSSGVVAPRPQYSDDPTLQGGQLLVWSPGGSTPAMRIDLFASNWKLGGSVAYPVYTYKAPDGSVSITLKAEKLVVKVKGAAVYSLVGAPQGQVAVQLKLGLEPGLCTVARAGKNDGTLKFDSLLNGAKPVACALLPDA